jgi:hypothetical protein
MLPELADLGKSVVKRTGVKKHSVIESRGTDGYYDDT